MSVAASAQLGALGAPKVSFLLVQSDARFAAATGGWLREQGCRVALESDGFRAFDAVSSGNFDVVVVDAQLAGMSGIELCRRLRLQSSIPLLVTTSRRDERECVASLEGGADDYLVKPLAPRELLAYARALLRRTRNGHPAHEALIQVGLLTVDAAAQSARMGENELPLTSYEFALLKVLAEHAGQVMGREELMQLARGSAEEAFDRSIDVHICRIRAKLGDTARPQRVLRTVRGAGYVLVAASNVPAMP
jgi:two-component system response regulator RstA